MKIDFISTQINLFLALASKDISTDKIKAKLDELKSFDDRIDFAKENLDKLGEGSSRIAFITDDNTVLKIAANEAGLEQNKNESNISNDYEFVNKILDYSKDNYWIESPYLEQLNESDFKDLTSVSFSVFSNAMRYALQDIEEVDREKNIKYNEVKNLPIFKELVSFAKKYEVLPGDLCRISSYKKLDNKPILIDFGLTKDTYKEFYE